MKRLIFILLFTTSLLFPLLAHAQTFNTTEIYSQATVVKIIKQETTISDSGYTTFTQVLQVRTEKGRSLTITQTNDARIAALVTYHVGQRVIVNESFGPNNTPRYTINDAYRIPQLVGMVLLFILVTLVFAGKKGIGAVVGLFVSLAVIIGYIVPQILFAKGDPLTVSIIGSTGILLATTFLAHGLSKQTALAVVSTFLALIVAYFLSVFFVSIAHLTGLGSEDSVLLTIAPGQAIDPKGLLLGGIIIGTLGALNDVTTTQVATIFALFKANPNQHFGHLIRNGLEVGREHIVSLVNTLVLAYAGTSLPIFIFLILNPNHVPLWVMINNQQFGEEIVRAIAGSIGLMLSVPIATLLAAYFVSKIIKNTSEKPQDIHTHIH